MHRNEIKEMNNQGKKETWHAWESNESIVRGREKNKRNVMHRNEIKGMSNWGKKGHNMHGNQMKVL
jgi:hypothetical protein